MALMHIQTPSYEERFQGKGTTEKYLDWQKALLSLKEKVPRVLREQAEVVDERTTVEEHTWGNRKVRHLGVYAGDGLTVFSEIQNEFNYFPTMKGNYCSIKRGYPQKCREQALDLTSRLVALDPLNLEVKE